MAQTAVTVNLNAAVIPFSASFKGQSVVIANRGDQTAGPARDFSGDTLEAASNYPQVYWAENVLPSQEGLFSVGYAQFVPAIPAPDILVDYEITLFDGQSNKGILAVTRDRQLWLLTGVNPTWQKLEIPAGEEADWTGRCTTAVAYGVSYIFLPGSGLYALDMSLNTFSKVTPVGINEDTVLGIVDSQSYLIMYSQNLIAWSSALDALDFTPDDITGAGAGTPEGLRGQIMFCKTISKGFVIYTSTITMAAEYTGNTRFPWIFRALNNGGGIADADAVSQDTSLSAHFMWGTPGVTEVNIQQCTPRFPQLTDFLAGEIWEEFKADMDQVVRVELSSQVRVRIALIASRFLCVSYGHPAREEYEFVNVFDSILQRWGRLRFLHRQCFEIVADTQYAPDSWEDTLPEQFDESDKSWEEYWSWNNGTARPKNTLGFIKSDGSIHVARMNYNASGSEGLLILGRLQLVRGHTSALQSALVQGINRGKTNFDLIDRVTNVTNGEAYNGVLRPLNELEQGRYTRYYASRIAGKNHNIIAKGNFHLCSVELMLTNAGRR